MTTWTERHPSDNFPLTRWFSCWTCGQILPEQNREDGSDIRCQRCDGEPGCVDPCVTCPMDGKPCNDERCTHDKCAEVVTP